MNANEKQGKVLMDGEMKRYYGLFGYVVTHISASEKNDPKEMGRRVRQLYEENSKQELMLCMMTNSNYETLSKEDNDETLGLSIQFQLLWENVNFKDIGLRIVSVLETYPEQELMLKAVTGYSYQELVDMIPEYEFDYDQIQEYYDELGTEFDTDELIERLKQELINKKE